MNLPEHVQFYLNLVYFFIIIIINKNDMHIFSCRTERVALLKWTAAQGEMVGAVEVDCHCLCLWLLTNLNRETEGRLGVSHRPQTVLPVLCLENISDMHPEIPALDGQRVFSFPQPPGQHNTKCWLVLMLRKTNAAKKYREIK